MRWSECPCRTRRHFPTHVRTVGEGWLYRAGYRWPSGGRSPLGERLAERLRAYAVRPWGARLAWGQGPALQGEPWLPETWHPTRLDRVLAWAREMASARHDVPLTWAVRWPPTSERGEVWGVYRLMDARAWTGLPEPPAWPRTDWVVQGLPGGVSGWAMLAPMPRGPESLWWCPECGWRAWARTAAWSADQTFTPAPAPAGEPELVATPDAATVDALARQLDVPAGQVLKSLFWRAERETPQGTARHYVIALVPGDRKLLTANLAAAVPATRLTPAQPDEIRALGAEPGYASPVGVTSDRVWVLADPEVLARGPWVAGANRAGYHLRAVWPGRDFTIHGVVPLAARRADDPCPRCGATVATHPAVLVGWSRHLTAQELETVGVHPAGQSTSPWVLDMVEWEGDALAEALAQAYHDEEGLAWPLELAAFDVHLITLWPRKAAEREAMARAARGLYDALQQAGFAVFWDDRDASPGVKFTDASFLGFPWWVVLGPRGLARHEAEVGPRGQRERAAVPLEAVPRYLQQHRASAAPSPKQEVQG